MPATSNLHVLVVDDYEPLRFMKAHLLRKAGFVVREAATGAAALDSVASEKPDAVLLDVHLPDMDGAEVLRKIKGARPLPVICTSAASIPQEMQDAADGCIVGVETADLLRTLAEALGSDKPVRQPSRTPIKDRDGCPSTAFAPAERSTAEELERHARLFESSVMAVEVLNQLPIAAAVLNANRQIVFCNRPLLDVAGAQDSRAVLGMRPGELLKCVNAQLALGGCGTTEFCHTCGAVRAILEGQEGHRSVQECQLTPLANGAQGPLDLRVSIAPLGESDQFVLCSIADITQEKHRRALERVFFHDVLSAATSLQGLADRLAESLQPSPEARHVELIREAAADLVAGIRGQQQLVEAEGGELVVSSSPVDTRRWLEALVNRLSDPRAQVAPDTVAVKITTDPSLLSRVLGNMLKNALEATGPKGRVTAGCRRWNGGVEFRVHNPGSMAEEVQLQVFRRSFTTKGPGRGLGTYSMKLLTELYLGGRISFCSTSAEGTTFFVRLPSAIPVARLRAALE